MSRQLLILVPTALLVLNACSSSPSVVSWNAKGSENVGRSPASVQDGSKPYVGATDHNDLAVADARSELSTPDYRDAASQGQVFLVGSTVISKWEAGPDKSIFPGKDISNRGVHGLEYQNFRLDVQSLVERRKPSTLILAAGDNELYLNRPISSIVSDVEAILATVSLSSDKTKVVILSLPETPAMSHLRSATRELNAKIKRTCEARTNCIFVDAAARLRDAKGEPSPNFFSSDGMFLSKDGYELYSRALSDALKQKL